MLTFTCEIVLLFLTALRVPHSVCLFVCAFSVGVPKSRRGEVWLLLSQQYRLRHRLPQRQQPPETPYQDLLKQLTAQQHAILVDLGLYLTKVLIVCAANSHIFDLEHY